MAKALRDEDLRLNIIINGDAGRKSIEDLKRSTHDGKIALDALIASQKQLEAQGKKNTRNIVRLRLRSTNKAKHWMIKRPVYRT